MKQFISFFACLMHVLLSFVGPVTLDADATPYFSKKRKQCKLSGLLNQADV